MLFSAYAAENILLFQGILANERDTFGKLGEVLPLSRNIHSIFSSLLLVGKH